MADSKITALDENTTPASTDLTVIVDDPGGTPATQKMTIDTLDDYLSATTKTLTNKTLTAPLFQGLVDSWISANATWAYASATTITVPSGAATIYQKGDKFKLTANSVVLQGYIVTVADELLTVVGDALTDHTFTANYYSHASSPIGFPQTFAFTSTITSGSGTVTEETITQNNELQIIGNKAMARFYIELTNIGSGSPTGIMKFTFPVVPVLGSKTRGCGIERQATGVALSVSGSETGPVITVAKYDYSTCFVNGYLLNFICEYKF